MYSRTVAAFLVFLTILLLTVPLRPLVNFIAADVAFFAFCYFHYARRRSVHDRVFQACQDLQERINVLERDVERSQELGVALDKKIADYKSLESFAEILNDFMNLDHACSLIVGDVFKMFNGRGHVLLYLINEKHRRPELRATRTVVEGLKIKEKTGDLFDHWVLRHGQPLLVGSSMSDFRFDPERIAQELSRPVGSLVCVPLVSPTALLGLLRIESEPLESFSADDLRFLSVIADIAALAVENAILMGHMQELSVTDGLTGLFLRRIGEERLRHELLRAEEAAHPLAFLMIDIDHFKNFNDSFGHISGDIILRRLAKWLQGFFEVPGSCVFRYGGEEFGVILPMVTKAEATRLADSWREFVKEKAMMLRREKIALTVSVGVACFPLDARRAEDLVRGADMALLVAKKGGRDRTCGR